MVRKLASIRRIDAVLPVDGDSKVEVAVVGGWKVVVLPGTFHAGDRVVYYEIDSFLPADSPLYEFLGAKAVRTFQDQRGYLLKTMRSSHQLSQGLLLPLDTVFPSPDERETLQDGDDVTERLGVIKYDVEHVAENRETSKGWPAFLPKTDEERVQNLCVEYQYDWALSTTRTFYLTEKLDGSSSSFFLTESGEFGICSRNLQVYSSDRPEEKSSNATLYTSVAEALEVEKKMRASGRTGFCLQGELIGPKVQSNPYKLATKTLRFFNMFDIGTQRHVPLDEFVAFVGQLGLETVPILSHNYPLPPTVSEMLAAANGPSVLCPDTKREGVVVRSTDRRVSFKAISNAFLLQDKK